MKKPDMVRGLSMVLESYLNDPDWLLILETDPDLFYTAVCSDQLQFAIDSGMTPPRRKKPVPFFDQGYGFLPLYLNEWD